MSVIRWFYSLYAEMGDGFINGIVDIVSAVDHERAFAAWFLLLYVEVLLIAAIIAEVMQ